MTSRPEPKISRRKLLATGATASLLMSGVARSADEVTLRWGSSTPGDHPVNVRAAEAAQRISEELRGRYKVQLFPGGQLGGDTDMLSQLRTGALDLYTTSPPFLTSLVPAAGLSGVAFAFPDYEAVWRAMDGGVGAAIRSAAARAGIHVFDRLWDQGYRQITTSTKPIQRPEDLQGFKIRVAAVPLFHSLFQKLGSAPTTLNLGEVYTALQTKLVDGQENALGNAYASKFHEVQKFVSMTNHVWDGFIMTANARSFSALPKDVRDTISKHINEAGLLQRQDVLKLNDQVRSRMEAAGLRFNTVDAASFRKKLQDAGYYTEWKTKFGPEAWAALEAHTGRLG